MKQRGDICLPPKTRFSGSVRRLARFSGRLSEFLGEIRFSGSLPLRGRLLKRPRINPKALKRMTYLAGQTKNKQLSSFFFLLSLLRHSPQTQRFRTEYLFLRFSTGHLRDKSFRTFRRDEKFYLRKDFR
jgi:hypothetical protein